MKSLFPCVLTLLIFTSACVQGPGSYYEGELQVVAQISESHEDHPEDQEEAHWQIEHIHFNVAGIQLRQSSNAFTQIWDEPASAELSENPAEIFHLNAPAGVEFDEAFLILGENSEDHHHEEPENEMDNPEEKHSSLSLEAQLESQMPCQLHLVIHEPGLSINLALNEPFTIVRDQIQSLQIQIDFSHLLEHLPAQELCAQGEEVHVSETENPEVYEEVLEHFQEIFTANFSAAELPEEDSDHDHNHDHE